MESAAERQAESLVALANSVKGLAEHTKKPDHTAHDKQLDSESKIKLEEQRIANQVFDIGEQEVNGVQALDLVNTSRVNAQMAKPANARNTKLVDEYLAIKTGDAAAAASNVRPVETILSASVAAAIPANYKEVGPLHPLAPPLYHLTKKPHIDNFGMQAETSAHQRVSMRAPDVVYIDKDGLRRRSI
jgi:hypothetical protein